MSQAFKRSVFEFLDTFLAPRTSALTDHLRVFPSCRPQGVKVQFNAVKKASTTPFGAASAVDRVKLGSADPAARPDTRAHPDAR